MSGFATRGVGVGVVVGVGVTLGVAVSLLWAKAEGAARAAAKNIPTKTSKVKILRMGIKCVADIILFRFTKYLPATVLVV
jgi:hypothetical protein